MSEYTSPTGPAPLRLALSPEQAAVALGLGRTMVYGLIKTGQLRSLRVGTRRIIPVGAVEEFLAGLSDDVAL